MVRASLYLLVTLALLSGCTTVLHTADRPELLPAKPVAPLLQNTFHNVPVESEEAIFALSEAQQQRFLAYFHAPENQHLASHMRLYHYLEQSVNGFHYRGDTFNAYEAHARNEGNCLSLAILTTALANLAGLEVEYQQVNSAPVYQRYGGLMTLSSHVRTFVYQSDFEVPDDTLVLRQPRVVIDYFPERGDVGGKPVSHEDFVAMYYQNLAAQAMLEGDTDLANSLLNASLQTSPLNAESLNALAVLYRQTGHVQASLGLFDFAYQHTSDSANLISNFAQLLESQGDVARADALRQNIAHIEDHNPYRWLDIGYDYLANHQLYLARKYFTRAIEVAPYLHEGHFGLAKTFMSMGWDEPAKDSLESARQLAMYSPKQRLYQAKLHSLQHHGHVH